MSCTLRQQPAGAPNCKMVCFPTSSSRPAISTTSPRTSPPGKSAAKGAGSTFAAFRPKQASPSSFSNSRIAALATKIRPCTSNSNRPSLAKSTTDSNCAFCKNNCRCCSLMPPATLTVDSAYKTNRRLSSAHSKPKRLMISKKVEISITRLPKSTIIEIGGGTK